ncbi:sigma 54-interacting transcriptional regulator [Ferviditalea candida]|uniref:Sigma 54-interacting transcriptional regulator n=1 Tax=Ferviditalea candida TaxID=3108399 RepID=A0ABU5ZH16_9BACL|nr:sigma 54-interacting transcriptional regulator [Paenibacillaceae bacterium T2]
MIWRDILQPPPVMVQKNCTLLDAVNAFNRHPSEIVLICDGETPVGYVDSNSLLAQIEHGKDLSAAVSYQVDVLKVPSDHPVEFYHNISVYLGIDADGYVTGFSTNMKARDRINQLKLNQMNRIFNSSGLGIVTTGENFEITFVNETAEKNLGLSGNFLMNRNYKALWAGHEVLDEVLRGKQLVSIESLMNFKRIIGNFSPLFENRKITGIVHIFYLKEQFEEAVKELEFVRNLHEDLKAIYSLSNEQVITVNAEGEIVRIAGTLLKNFWMIDGPEQLLGANIRDFENKGIFQPNIVDLCKRKKQKLTQVQISVHGQKVLSVATPVFHGDKLEQVVVASKDITEINQLKQELERLKKKSDQYKRELDQFMMMSEQKKLIYRSQVMENLLGRVKQIAAADSAVLLYGEFGVGKEVFAQTIHENSGRKNHPFLRINCGAVEESLAELLRSAEKGSIFLDEITELSMKTQAQLLEVLNSGIDVRVIAATNQIIKKRVQENTFSERLFDLLNGIPITIPPLRERAEDIVSLSIHLLQRFNHAFRKDTSFTKEALEVLESYHWPGNVRELQNVIERLIVTTLEDMITGSDVRSILYGDAKLINL